MYDSILNTEYNFISLKSIKVYGLSNCFSFVKLLEPNNKFSIEITVYGVILIINCILAFV